MVASGRGSGDARAWEPKTASLNPDDAVDEERFLWGPEGTKPIFSIRQVDRAPAVKAVGDLLQHGARCACDRPLVDARIELLRDTGGWSLHVRGVCLACGHQQTYYVLPAETSTERKHEALRAEVQSVVEQLLALKTPEVVSTAAPAMELLTALALVAEAAEATEGTEGVEVA